MTETQWSKIIDRLHKFREVKMPDGERLILWENGDVSLRDGQDGHCISCNLDTIKASYVPSYFSERFKKRREP